MTRPRRPRPTAKLADAPVLDPVVAKVLEKAVEKPESPFAGLGEVSPFADLEDSVSPFAGLAEAEAPSVLSGLGGGRGGPSLLSGLAGLLRGRSRSGLLRHPSGVLEPRGDIVIHEVLMPPPPDKVPPWSNYWLRWCDMKAILRYQYEGLDAVAHPVGGIADFDEAAEIGGAVCYADHFSEGEPLPEGHQLGDAGYCLSHKMVPEHSGTFKQALNRILDCDEAPGFEYGRDQWDELVPLFRELRPLAKARARELLEQMYDLDVVFKMAGVPMDLVRRLPRKAQELVILAAVETGNMLGDAFLDFMLYWEPLAIDTRLGELANELITEAEGLLPWPEQVFVFKSFHKRTYWEMVGEGQAWPHLHGEYVVSKVEYHSVIDHPDLTFAHGFVGVRVVYLDPWDGYKIVENPMYGPP